MNWEVLIDERELAKLLPQEYNRFATPVKEALCVFLSGISVERQSAILQAQLALPSSATVSQRLGVLALSCPVLQKLGQTLSREPNLGIELRRELQKLESLSPTVELTKIQRVLQDELGPLEARGVRLTPPAIAEASVAVVIPFAENRSAGSTNSRQGVFKLLKPGIEAILEEELSLLGSVGSHLDDRCEELGIPALDYQDSFNQVREKLLSELDLAQEQRNLEAASKLYEDDAQTHIPSLLEHCTPRVTAMERIYGGKIVEASSDGTVDRDRLPALVTRALLSRPMLAQGEPALYHGDPHAGNLFLTTDGQLAILDWSLAGVLSEAHRVAMNQIMLGAITLRDGKVCEELEALSDRHQIDREELREVVAEWLKRIRRGHFPGLRWLVGLMDDATQRARLRVAPELMLFRKSLLTIGGVLADLGADDQHNDRVLIREFLKQFGVEWPGRWVSVPTSRDFGTRLSNVDLTEVMLNFPWAVARFWIDGGRDTIKLWSRPIRREYSRVDS